jgi:hypothetical protein
LDLVSRLFAEINGGVNSLPCMVLPYQYGLFVGTLISLVAVWFVNFDLFIFGSKWAMCIPWIPVCAALSVMVLFNFDSLDANKGE